MLKTGAMIRVASTLLFALFSLSAGCGSDAVEAECTDFCTSLGCLAADAACEPGQNTCACHGCQAFYNEYFGDMPRQAPMCTPDIISE